MTEKKTASSQMRTAGKKSIYGDLTQGVLQPYEEGYELTALSDRQSSANSTFLRGTQNADPLQHFSTLICQIKRNAAAIDRRSLLLNQSGRFQILDEEGCFGRVQEKRRGNLLLGNAWIEPD